MAKINHDAKLPPLVTTMPTSATHATARVAEASQGRDLARKGGKPKVHAVPVHSGMHSRDRNGNLNVGVTQTTVANAPDASGRSPLDPTQPGKRLTPPMAHPSMRSRINDTLHAGAPGENHARNAGAASFDHAIGKQILREATMAPDDAAALFPFGRS